MIVYKQDEIVRDLANYMECSSAVLRTALDQGVVDVVDYSRIESNLSQFFATLRQPDATEEAFYDDEPPDNDTVD